MSGLFRLGNIVATSGASDLFDRNGNPTLATELLARHANGDFGEMCKEDCDSNRFAIEEGGQVMSSYSVGSEKVWIITEWDRSVTTFLLPDEY